jgi:hypothetical protein
LESVFAAADFKGPLGSFCKKCLLARAGVAAPAASATGKPRARHGCASRKHRNPIFDGFKKIAADFKGPLGSFCKKLLFAGARAGRFGRVSVNATLEKPCHDQCPAKRGTGYSQVERRPPANFSK